MAGSLTLTLQTAQSGLMANQQLLDSIANNVANVSTEGYSRKIVALKQRVVAGVGAGVEVGEIARMVDEGLLRGMRKETAFQFNYNTLKEYYGRIQDSLGTPADNSSLVHIASTMIGAMEKLATSSEKLLEQNELVRQANDLAIKVDQMSGMIQDLRLLADQDIAAAIKSANNLISSIAQLNDTIVRNSAANRDVTDLKDQRDLALDKLSELMDINYFNRSDGDIIVMTKSGRSLTLVDNVASALTHDSASSTSATVTHTDGQIKGIYIGEEISANDITNNITGGKIGALIELRDSFLTDLQSGLDEFSARIRDTFNQVHNRGIPFPGIQSTTGTRNFFDPSVQTMKLDPTNGVDDVMIGLFDGDGNPLATTTLNNIMTSGTYGSGAQTSHGAWTINEVAQSVNDWLRANGAASAAVTVNSSGKFDIQLNSTSLSLAFRDQQSSVNGSTLEDAAIGFDKDGDGTVDETVNGFSYFLGLNDFFIDSRKWNRYDSDVMTSNVTSGSASSTLKFVDSSGTMATVIVPAGKTLAEIATQINTEVTNATASVIPDGDGFRLRISHKAGSDFSVIQTAGTLLTDLGLHLSEAGTANSIEVRSDILNNPAKVSGPVIQWDPDYGGVGRYFVSSADPTIAKDLATEFHKQVTFDKAGSIAKSTVSFTQYVTSFISNVTGTAAHNETQAAHKDILVSSLRNKSDNVRGVNLDEEMSNMLLFEQAYSAAARVMTTVQRMLDTLESIFN